MTTKHEIIKLIAESHENIRGILGDAIVDASKEVLNREVDLDKTMVLLEDALLIIYKARKDPQYKAKYTESLKKILNEL